MNGFLRQAIKDIQRVWEGLTRAQKGMAIGAVLLAIVAILGLVLWAEKPDYAPLFTSLDPQDAGAIVAKLKDDHVNYQLSDGGATILVPSSKVYDLRLEMASSGLPQDGTVGFEIFDKQSFGLTDAMQRVDYQRALQGELARTISTMDGVESARVHLVMPEPDLFSDDTQSDPTAAVVLKLQPGAQLTPEQARTITHLVAKSVQGLKESNVILTDEAGRNYSDMAGTDDQDAMGAELSLKQLSIKRDIQKSIRDNVQAMLDRVLGPNGAVVNVAADVDFSQQETNSDLFTPVATGTGSGSIGIPRSSHLVTEVYNGSKGGAIGVPGVTSNVPTYQAQASGSAGLYEKTDNLTNYEIDETKTRSIKQPAVIKRLQVAVAVNGDLPKDQLDNLKALVANAAGVDPTRGDTVVVSALKFNDAQAKAEMADEKAAEQKAEIVKYAKVGVALLVGLIALFVLRKGLSGGDEEPFSEVPLSMLPDESGRPRFALDRPQEDERRSMITAEISKMVKSQPDEVARLVKSWMSEED